MSSTSFTIPQCNLLLSLLHLREPATTADLYEAFGFDKVEPAVRKALTEHGHIAVHKAGRSFVYELTDAGWLAARQIIGSPAAKGASSRTARILWAVLADIAAYMERAGTELADVYATPETGEEATADPADLVVSAYGELSNGPGRWLPLIQLREHLHRLDRTELDTALTDLFKKREIRLLPEENQKTLTIEDREAALWLGGEYKHFIAIESR